jgi:hypothetical protein
MNDLTTVLDIDLSRQDVQALSSADGVAAFFARLGYNTDARTAQTPGNLGITADSTVRPIKEIELIADQEGLLQVYLFELQSVTVTHTHGRSHWRLAKSHVDKTSASQALRVYMQ